MAGLNIKKGDLFQVITGKDKGLQGKVIQAFPETEKVLVEGVNRVKKHTKVTTGNRGAKQGGIETVEASISVSNVMVIDAQGTATRVGYRRDDETGRNVRVSRRSGKDI